MRNRNDEEAVARVRDTGECVVPGEEGSEESKVATSLDAGRVGRATRRMKVADAEQEERHVEGEEEQEERNGRLERADEEDCGEDEPSLLYR